MPHVPTAPPGTRFFARIDDFHCECPACGALIVAHATTGGTQRRRRRARGLQYNPITSVLYCPSCRRAFGVGLMLWPLRRCGNTRQIPADHQPTRRQMRALAQYAYGIWADEIKRQGDELNLAIDAECTCPPQGWRQSCPVHGWDAFTAAQEALGAPGPPPPVEPEEDEEEE
jgi:uncharacterized protein YbaR (Trm112 family)